MKKKVVFLILSYFRILAQLQLKKNPNATIIGMTGSAGKTSTRNAIAAALQSTNKKIKVSYKANSETGIPLNILGLAPQKYTVLEWLTLIIRAPLQLLFNWEQFDYYVVEMGIDGPYQPKNMEYLLRILTPDIGILLNAAPMHSQPFDHLVHTKNLEKRAKEITKLIANEKGKIVTRLKSTKIGIINTDQSEFRPIQKATQAKIFRFGKNTTADIQITNYSISKKGTQFEFFNHQKDQRFTIFMNDQLLPEHFGYTFAATLCVAAALGIPLTQAARSIEKQYKLPAGRATLLKGVNDSILIDSSYNASTKPTLDLLEMLKKIEANKRYAILGDIRELGEVAKSEHEAVSKLAATVCDEVCLVGPQMKSFAEPILKKSKKPYVWCATAYQAGLYLKEKLQKDDLVLIKGSQNTLLLEIATEILLKYSTDSAKLPRRGEFWDNKRSELLPEQL